jgi:histidinol phosphatase-like PHP family hydrolase
LNIEDLHTHTIFSDGKLNPKQVYALAADKGYKVGISDHCGEGSFQINDDVRFQEYLKALEGLAVYRSTELDLGTRIEVSDSILRECDYLIAGIHSIDRLNFFDENADLPHPQELLELVLDLIDAKAVRYKFDLLAHPGLLPIGYRGRKKAILDKKWSQHLVELALKYGFALEISSRWEPPTGETIGMALEAGVRFSLGSDGHCRDTVCKLDYSLSMIEKYGISEEQMFKVKKSV